MKLYLLSFLFVALSIQVSAQNTSTVFDVNGLKVIFHPTQKQTVSVAMYFRGGVMNYPSENAGIENLALSTAVTCGTKKYAVQDYKELADEYGVEISGGSTTDYGVISMDCICKYLDKGWKLFSDAIVSPNFDPAEFSNEKQRIITNIHYQESNPESMIDQITLTSLYKNTPYGTLPLGNDSSLKKLNTDNVKNYYYNTLLNKQRMFLVVAGKITKEELEQKIKEAFFNLPSKPYTPAIYNDIPLKGEKLVTVQRSLATNYISRVMNAPAMSNPDYPAFKVAITILSSYLHFKLRTEQALSYAPGARIKTLQLPYTSLYVSTTQPKKSIIGMIEAVKTIKQGDYNISVIDDIKKGYKQADYRKQEIATEIVQNLGEAEILGDYKLEENFLANLKGVSFTEISRVFKKYLTGSIWIGVGDEQLLEDVFK